MLWHHKKIYFPIIALLLIVPLRLFADAPYSASDERQLQINGEMAQTTFPGINIAQFTLTRRQSSAQNGEKRLSFAASFAIAPIVGVSIARKITGRSPASSANFLTSLLGAYISTAITTCGLALLRPLQEIDSTDVHNEPGFRNGFNHGSSSAFNVMIQIALPSFLPGVHTAVSQTLRPFRSSNNVEITVLCPALFQSPVNERQLLLGVNLLEGKF